MSEEAAGVGGQSIARPNLAELWLLELMEMHEDAIEGCGRQSIAPPNAATEGLSGRLVFSQVSGAGLRAAREDAAVGYGGASKALPNADEDALSWGRSKTLPKATEDVLSLGGVNATRLRGVLEEATEGGGGRSIALPNAAEDGLWWGEVLLRGGASDTCAVVVNWATEELRAAQDAATGRDATGLP